MKIISAICKAKKRNVLALTVNGKIGPYCPRCLGKLGAVHTDYCPRCGQHLVWYEYNLELEANKNA